jgi:hypothetical protein
LAAIISRSMGMAPVQSPQDLMVKLRPGLARPLLRDTSKILAIFRNSYGPGIGTCEVRCALIRPINGNGSRAITAGFDGEIKAWSCEDGHWTADRKLNTLMRPSCVTPARYWPSSEIAMAQASAPVRSAVLLLGTCIDLVRFQILQLYIDPC